MKKKTYVAKRKVGKTYKYCRINKEGFYLKNKQHYKNMLKPYQDSPTGKAYVGFAKEPLMKNKKGYGYQGVLLQDETRQFVQCAACGEWMKSLQAGHLKKCSGLSPDEYKEKYGLNKTARLSSDELRNNRAELTRNSEALKGGRRSNLKSGAWKEGLRKFHARKEGRESMEYKNSKGTCPEQIKDRLREFIATKGRMPGRGNGGGTIINLLKRRFGTINEGFAYYGLPTRKGSGGLIEYRFPDDCVYFSKAYEPGNYERLFELLKEKCLILNT